MHEDSMVVSFRTDGLVHVNLHPCLHMLLVFEVTGNNSYVIGDCHRQVRTHSLGMQANHNFGMRQCHTTQHQMCITAELLTTKAARRIIGHNTSYVYHVCALRLASAMTCVLSSAC